MDDGSCFTKSDPKLKMNGWNQKTKEKDEES
jgi:hypothetical protein